MNAQVSHTGPEMVRDNGQFEKADALFKQAISHLDKNRVAEALQLLQQCQSMNPSHSGSARALAAVAMQNGAEAQGRALMETFFSRYPGRTLRASRLGKEPALLSIRGFSGTRIIPRRAEDGSHGTRFRGGHFTTKFLIVNATYPEHKYTIARDNILQPGALPDFKVMLNTIADPDVERPTLEALETYLAGHPDTAVLNHPAKVLHTTRDANYRRLRDAPGITFPQTHRVDFQNADADGVTDIVRKLGLDDAPVILRAVGTHTARTTGLIRTRDDLDAYLDGGRLSGEHYLIRYVERLWRGDYFRKLRLFSIDGTLFPVVCHIDRVWNVHGGNRKDVMRGDAALMTEEKRFLLDWRAYVGAANADRLETLAQTVGLEFFGIDFTCDDTGILIYEMNPAMRHSFDHAQEFDYKMPFDLQITQAFTDMVKRRLAA